jgi:hypothetical protein
MRGSRRIDARVTGDEQTVADVKLRASLPLETSMPRSPKRRAPLATFQQAPNASERIGRGEPATVRVPGDGKLHALFGIIRGTTRT